MKSSLTLILAAGWLMILTCGCNNATETKEENKSDSTTTAPAPSTESLTLIRHINDSMNIAIDALTSVIDELQDSADNVRNDNTKKEKILDCRANIFLIRENARTTRNQLTSAALVDLTARLSPVINQLARELGSLQKLSERVSSAVTIFGLIDKTLAAAISAGFLKAPVVLPN
jgi:molecular chaperone GrpE (heat shock protein)